MSFQWQKAKEVLSAPLHKGAPDWPDAFLPEDLAALQFPESNDDRMALLRCIRAAVRNGDVQTVSTKTTRDSLPGRRPPTASSDLRQCLRELDAGRQIVEVKAIDRGAFASLLARNGIDEPSEHVAAWLRPSGSIPATKECLSTPAAEGTGRAAKVVPRTRTDGLSHAIDAGMIAYRHKKGIDPSARALFDWLADHDETYTVSELDSTNDKIFWKRQDGGLTGTTFKAFQNRMTAKLRK